MAAAFIAPTIEASVCRRLDAIPRSRSCTRCTDPHENESSAAPNPAAGRLFQFRIAPLAGSTACGWPDAPTNPRQSCSPVPRVGSAPLAPTARTGSRPALYIAMLRSSA